MKKTISILLTFTILLSCIGVTAVYAEAEYTEVSTPVSVMPQYYDAKADYGSVTWYEDGEYMDKSDTFKEGKTYSVTLYIDTIRTSWDDVATFSENPTATLNGFAVDEKDIERLTDTTVMITYTFPSLHAEKTPNETDKSFFNDVPKGEYYYDAVLWAVENDITGGTSESTFSPESVCTRAQVVTFLYRFAKDN